MKTVSQTKPELSLGDIGLAEDTYGEFELLPMPEGFDPLDRSNPRSSVDTAAAILFDRTREGMKTEHDYPLLDADGNAIMDAYMIHDYGTYPGRGEQVLLVPLKAVNDPDTFNEARAVVRVYLNADPDFRHYEDVLPLHIRSIMGRAGGQAAELVDAQSAFWMLEGDRIREERRTASQQVTEALAQEGPAPVEPVQVLVVEEGEPAQALKKAIDFKDADMSAAMSLPIEGAPYEIEVYEAATDYRKEHAYRMHLMLGTVLPHAVKHGFLTLDNVAELLQAMVKDVDYAHRISALGVEELRPDRWRIQLWCREGGKEGRARSAHTVHLTAASFGMDYRVTGPKKYPHQLENLEHIKACLDRVLTSQL